MNQPCQEYALKNLKRMFRPSEDIFLGDPDLDIEKKKK